jgi:hypothetical protein
VSPDTIGSLVRSVILLIIEQVLWHQLPSLLSNVKESNFFVGFSHIENYVAKADSGQCFDLKVGVIN